MQGVKSYIPDSTALFHAVIAAHEIHLSMGQNDGAPKKAS